MKLILCNQICNIILVNWEQVACHFYIARILSQFYLFFFYRVYEVRSTFQSEIRTKIILKAILYRYRVHLYFSKIIMLKMFNYVNIRDSN